MKLISVRETPSYTERALAYIQSKWASEASRMVYEDCIKSCVRTSSPLPHWYVLVDEQDEIIGCAGLITNDFISRMDLYPWICAVYIEEAHRGNGYGHLLMTKAGEDAAAGGFDSVYLCTDHIGYYEKYGFNHIGTGYHPWGDTSRIYERSL